MWYEEHHSAAFWVRLIVIGVVVLFFAVMALLLLGVFIASCFEKQRVRDYAAGKPETLPPPLPYLRSMNESARVMGFQPGGVFAKSQSRFGQRLSLTLWLSPDQTALLCIMAGKVIGTPYKRSFLVSKLGADKFLVTIDSFGTEDLSGALDIEVLLNADLTELSGLHSRRLAMARVPPQPFAPRDLLGEFERIQQVRAEHLAARGMAKFLEPSRNEWRFSVKGAWNNVFMASTKGFQRAQSQRDRARLTRPGG